MLPLSELYLCIYSPTTTVLPRKSGTLPTRAVTTLLLLPKKKLACAIESGATNLKKKCVNIKAEIAAIAIQVYALDAIHDKALLRKCSTNLLLDFVKQVYTKLDLRYPTESDIHTAEKAKIMGTLAAESLQQAQLVKFFQTKRPAVQYYKVLQKMSLVCLYSLTPPSSEKKSIAAILLTSKH